MAEDRKHIVEDFEQPLSASESRRNPYPKVQCVAWGSLAAAILGVTLLACLI